MRAATIYLVIVCIATLVVIGLMSYAGFSSGPMAIVGFAGLFSALYGTNKIQTALAKENFKAFKKACQEREAEVLPQWLTNRLIGKPHGREIHYEELVKADGRKSEHISSLMRRDTQMLYSLDVKFCTDYTKKIIYILGGY